MSHLLLPAILLSAALPTSAQQPVPDPVCTGTRVSYWVDSAGNTGSAYTWAIDGAVVQRGATCLFVHAWNSAGTFELTLQKVSARGCRGELRSVRVIVVPALVPEFTVRIYPNPLNSPVLKFQLASPVGSKVTIDLFTSSGQLISRIFDGYLPGGESRTIAYSHNLPQGTYLYQVRTENQMINGRIMVIRAY
jgi:hypothetical protein